MFGLSKKGLLIRRIFTILTVMILASCNMPSTPAPVVTSSPIPPTSIPPTVVPPTVIPPTETPLPHTTIDASSMEHKLMMGYQGWFTCQGDGSNTGYLHWFKTNVPDAASFRVDMWPDASELTPEERCPTFMKYPNGETAYLYSAFNPKTVMRHFQWMSQYGVDGVFVQRFGSQLTVPALFNTRNVVTENARAGAEAYGRVFAMEYDTSGMDSSTFVDILEKDWKYMVDVMKITESPSYLRHNGKPVLAVWGVGFVQHPGTPQQTMELINFFENNPDPKYQVTLVGGVPHEWRTLQGDSQTDPAWADVYCALDVLTPWTVGLYTSDLDVDLYKLKMIQDMAAASACGVEYMPTIFPGTAFHNNNPATNRFNATPRRGGNFYWRQVYNAVSIDVPMIYNAMFDEVDEDTAMYKIAATANDQPVGVDLVSMDTDGYALPNDWYLRLAGAASQMLRGEIPLTQTIPIDSGATPPPTPVGTYRIRIQITTTSDWATLELKSGGALSNPGLASVSPEAINMGIFGNRFSIGQPSDRVRAGMSVELVVDVYLTGLQTGVPLKFEIQSGANGHTTVRIYNYQQDTPVEVNKTILYEMISTFEVPAEQFMSP